MSSDDKELQEIRERKLQQMISGEPTIKSKFPQGVAVDITDSDFEEFVKSGKIVVVDTWASWCMPCRTMAPIMEQLAKEWGDKGVMIGKLNVDKNRRTAMKYNVSSIPNFLVFQNGAYLGNIVGAVGKKPFVNLFKKLIEGKDPTKEGYA